MPSKSSMVTTGLIDQVRQFIVDNAAAIDEGGTDATKLTDRLAPASVAVTQSQLAADNADRVAHTKHSDADVIEDGAYATASTIVDNVAGAVGKKTDLGKQILAIRADANRRRRPSKISAATAKKADAKATAILSE